VRTTILVGFWTVFSFVLFGQEDADATKILKKVGATYLGAKEYLLEADASGRESSGRMLMAFKPPNRYRMEGTGLFGDDPAFASVVIVDDGSFVWFYLPKVNQYASISTSQLTEDAPGDLGDLRPEAMDSFMMSRYREAADSGGAKLLREETLEIAGARVDCLVLQVSPRVAPSIHTWWVDRRNNQIVREDDAVSSTVFTTIRLNMPVADELFKFTPPPGAKKIEPQH
jgi:outer membrane lipoprotein-sorting protein